MEQSTPEQRIAALESRLRRQGLLLAVMVAITTSVILWLAFVSRYIGWPQANVILRADRVLTKELIVTDENEDLALIVNGAKGGGSMYLYGSQGKPAMTISSFDQGGGKIILYTHEGKESFVAPAQEP